MLKITLKSFGNMLATTTTTKQQQQQQQQQKQQQQQQQNVSIPLLYKPNTNTKVYWDADYEKAEALALQFTNVFTIEGEIMWNIEVNQKS